MWHLNRMQRNILLSGSLLFIVVLASLQVVLALEGTGVVTEQVWLTTSDGIRLKGEVYTPKVSSHALPGIVVCHGLLASSQTMQSFSLELAKRGFMVVAIDLQGHGDSDGSISIEQRSVHVYGDDDYIEVDGSTSLDLQKEFTLSAWINAGGGMEQVIIDKKSSYQDRNYKFSLSDDGALQLRFSSRSSDIDGDVTGYTNLKNAGWKHVVGVYNGTHCILFVDGEFQASAPSLSPPEGVGGDLWIGRGSYAGSQREFNGTIDEVQISNTARSVAWIKASYESERDHLVDFGREELNAGGLLDWSKRITLTINPEELDGALSNFPVLIHLSNSSGRNHMDVSSIFNELERNENRKKIAVTTGDGVTQCFVEIEKWDAINEEAWLWVKAPSLSAVENTTFYLYYDKGAVNNEAYVGDTDSLPAEHVWDDHFQLVIHMNGDSDTIQVKDSTSHDNDGTKKYGPTEASGKIGNAQHFAIKNLLQQGTISVDSKLELDVKAAVDYLLSSTQVDHDKIAVLGHSLGGATVIREGYSDPRVKSVVAIAPASWVIVNSTFPQNLLLILGSHDFIVRETSVRDLLKLATGGGEEIGTLYGNFSQGNARKMVVSPGPDHAGEMFDPQIVSEAINWVETSLDTDSTASLSLSPWHAIFNPLSVMTCVLSIFPAMTCIIGLRKVIRKGKPAHNIQSTQMGLKKLVFFYLLSWIVALLASLMLLWFTFSRTGVEGVFLVNIWPLSLFPILFGGFLISIYGLVGLLLLSLFVIYKRTSHKLNVNLHEVKSNAIFGSLGFLLVFSIVNIVYTNNFIDLFPTTREFVLMMILFVLYLPLTLFEEVWLRNLQHRLPSKSWLSIGLPTVLYLFPRTLPLAFVAFVFGDFILFASALLVIPAIILAWLFHETESIASGVVFNALFSAWILAVIMPFCT